MGIKNLAYCIFEVSGKSIDILDWAVVNLLQDENEKDKDSKKCCANVTNKKTIHICNKQAKYVNPTNLTEYRCQIHAKSNKSLMLPQKMFTFPSLKKQTVSSLHDMCLKYKFPVFDKKYLKTELIDKLEKHLQINSWTVINKPINISADKVNLITIGRKLHSKLSNMNIMKDATHILIENQISPIANRMKTIQGMLTQEFIMLGGKNIEYVSSSNKLKKCLLNCKNSTYKDNKKNGIAYCQNRVQEVCSQKWLEFFNNNVGKKDDLADSFLQGLWYIEEKLINNATNIKINNEVSP